MSKLVFDDLRDRQVETGISRGVLYVQKDSGSYRNGIVWNGLTAVNEQSDGGEHNKIYADNITYASLLSPEFYKATIEAYTYPNEFMECDGTHTILQGVTLSQQRRRRFGLCYRSEVVNHTGIVGGELYKLHIVYNVTASPSEKSYATLSDSPDVISFSWDINADPIKMTNVRRSSCIVIDSSKLGNDEELKRRLHELEDVLYGTEDSEPTLPLPLEVFNIMNGGDMCPEHIRELFVDEFSNFKLWVWNTFNFKTMNFADVIHDEADLRVVGNYSSDSDIPAPGLGYTLISCENNICHYEIIVRDTKNHSEIYSKLKDRFKFNELRDIIYDGEAYSYVCDLYAYNFCNGGEPSGGDDQSVVLESITCDKNGTYYPVGGIDGYNEVIVDVEPALGVLNISQNGTYTAAEEDPPLDGYRTVNVSVSGGSGDDIRKLIDGTLSVYSDNVTTSIREYAFYNHSSLENVYFQKCTLIGSQAFCSCSSLITVSFPECTSIGNSAFYSCSSLSEIYFGKYTSIGNYMFSNFSKLTTASFPECTSIGNNAFQACGSLSDVYFPECTSIGNNAFQACGSLSDVYFPECTSIGSRAFDGCSSLITVSFPECISIGSRAFYSCSSLSEIYFGKYTSIGNYMFSNFSKLTTASFPECISIGSYVFYSCISLSDIYFPECISIESYAFYSCSSLITVSFPECTSIGNNAFQACGSLSDVSFPKCISIESYVFYSCISLSDISFPECISIGSQAFDGCSSLITVSFPECTSIGSRAFEDCNGLSEIYFPKCTSIGNQAFYSCSSLITVSFPECTSIGNNAFCSCSSLITVSFPKCTSIGYNAFNGCSSLITVSFPECTSIGSQAFYSCSLLSSVYLLGSQICFLSNSNAFYETPIRSQYGSIYVPASLYSDYIIAPNWSYYSERFVSV